MVKPDQLSTIVDLLVRAAAARSFSPAEAWNHGWSVQGYRDSPRAAMTHDAHRAVSLDPSGVAAFEQATNALLRLPNIVACYDGEEFWGLMASLVGSLPIGDTRDEIERRVTRLLSPPDSLAVLPLANIAPPVVPIRLGPVTVGPFDTSLASRLEATCKSGNKKPWWTTAASENELTTVVAYESRAQSRRALYEAEQAFDDVIAIALVLELDLDAKSLFSLRGDAHRPGTRGIAIDRAALSRVAKRAPEIRRELGADGIVSSVFGEVTILRWNGEEPFPLEALLSADARRDTVQSLLTSSSAVGRRLRVAARWHAKAHWASEIDDAVLAIGICFDAMLSEQGPSPGRALADRYAFLAADPTVRPVRYREFQSEFYPARSSVAHGARKGAVDCEFVRRFSKEARWTFARIWELSSQNNVQSESDYSDLYGSLKWGSR